MKISKYAAIDIGSNAIRLLVANVIEVNGQEDPFQEICTHTRARPFRCRCF